MSLCVPSTSVFFVHRRLLKWLPVCMRLSVRSSVRLCVCLYHFLSVYLSVCLSASCFPLINLEYLVCMEDEPLVQSQTSNPVSLLRSTPTYIPSFWQRFRTMFFLPLFKIKRCAGHAQAIIENGKCEDQCDCRSKHTFFNVLYSEVLPFGLLGGGYL